MITANDIRNQERCLFCSEQLLQLPDRDAKDCANYKLQGHSFRVSDNILCFHGENPSVMFVMPYPYVANVCNLSTGKIHLVSFATRAQLLVTLKFDVLMEIDNDFNDVESMFSCCMNIEKEYRKVMLFV
jgi:hypothetical protein